jgi:hypothetical protein
MPALMGGNHPLLLLRLLLINDDILRPVHDGAVSAQAVPGIRITVHQDNTHGFQQLIGMLTPLPD